MTARSNLDRESTMADGLREPGNRRDSYVRVDEFEAMPTKGAAVYRTLNPVADTSVGSARSARLGCDLSRVRGRRVAHGISPNLRDVQEFSPGALGLGVLTLVDVRHLLRFKEAEWVRWLQANGPGGNRNTAGNGL